MKCYYQIEDGSWISGEIVSMGGGTQINFHSRGVGGKVENQITLGNPETLFYGSGFSVTGYVTVPVEGHLTGNLYKLVTVDVRLSKPRAKAK